MRDILDEYKWLIDKLCLEFGGKCIRPQESDYGGSLGIAYITDKFRTAYMVEYCKNSAPIKWESYLDDDGQQCYEPVQWDNEWYSLNEDENKEEIVKSLIDKWKALQLKMEI